MTLKFVQITDTHIGATEDYYNTHGFHLQRGYPHRIEALVGALNALLEREAIDFVLHTGDMINEYSPAAISQAQEAFAQLSKPLYLCLGNHDLWSPATGAAGARAQWLTQAPAFFNADVNFTIHHADAHVHVLPNQWGADYYEWTTDQTPSFLAEQKSFIESALAQEPQKIHILATHAPLRAVAIDQVGTGVVRHEAAADFMAYVDDLRERFPHLKLVLNGHTHINMHVEERGCHFVGTSSFVEAPFDCKLFTVDESGLSMRSHSLGDDLDFQWTYDFNKTHIQGRPCDRTF